MKNKTFKVIYNAFPNAPGMRSETFVSAADEKSAEELFLRRLDTPEGTSVIEVTEA